MTNLIVLPNNEPYDCFGNCINDIDIDEICDELDDCIGEYDAVSYTHLTLPTNREV